MPRPRRPARPLVAVLAALAAAAPPAGPPIPPKTVTLSKPDATLADVLGEIRKQTGLAVDAPGLERAASARSRFDRTPFWTAVEQLAAKTGTRIALGKQGREIALVKRTGPQAPSSVDGPFRVVVQAGATRTDFETGKTYTEITLDVHWEPRFPVFRIDSEPDHDHDRRRRGSAARPVTAKARTPPGGFLYTTTVRVEGVPRAATKLTRLAGTFTVTASERMLPFAFRPRRQDAGHAAGAGGRDGDAAAVREGGRPLGGGSGADVPAGQPEFESFESWVTENRSRLVGPDKTLQAGRLRRAGAGPAGGGGVPLPRERRRRARKGGRWPMRHPAPLVEFPVRFDLKDIPLP